MERVVIVAVVVLFVAAVAVTAVIKAQGVAPAELVRRCEASAPEWKSYQEDIKGQVGASPVAQWRGEIRGVEQVEGGVAVRVVLEGAWADWGANLPILLREPLGGVYRQVRVTGEGRERVYHYTLDPASLARPLPWVELHYPHTERRIALDPSGRWGVSGG